MSGKVKLFSLVLAVVAAALFGFILDQTTEAGAAPKDIKLTATIRSLTTDKLLDDEQGPYISGVTPAGTVDIYLSKFDGHFYFYIDKGTNPLVTGRSTHLIFDDPVIGKPVMWMDPCPDPLDFVAVQPQIVRIRTWYPFVPNAQDPTLLEIVGSGALNLATMGMTVKKKTNPTHAYVGLSIGFYRTTDIADSAKYTIGDGGYPVEVTAYDIGLDGPRHWTIKTLEPPYHKDDADDDDRQLYLGPSEPDRCGYMWFHFPFQIDLYRN